MHSRSIQREGLRISTLKKYTEREPQYQYTQPSILGSKSLIYALFKCIYEEVSRRCTLKVYREQGASQVYFRSAYITSLSIYILLEYTERRPRSICTREVYREKASQHMHSRSIQREGLAAYALEKYTERRPRSICTREVYRERTSVPVHSTEYTGKLVPHIYTFQVHI